MPLATLHLISLNNTTTPSKFLRTLQTLSHSSQQYNPIIISRVIRWIITPEIIEVDQLLHPSKPWDLLYIHHHSNTDPDAETDFPASLSSQIHSKYTIQVGIPSRLLKDFERTNQSLLHPSRTPNLTGSLSDDGDDDKNLTSSSQDLTLSKDLNQWVQSFKQTKRGRSAVSMLNLLSFKPDEHNNETKEKISPRKEYIKYGQEFARSIGSKRGGNAKLVGHVIYPSRSSFSSGKLAVVNEDAAKGKEEGPNWEEFALAHYPSITHFADMLASEDYQAVNQKYRVPSLFDTCILCTSEIDVEEDVVQEGKGAKAKL